MAPTEGRVARPERRWGCRRGTPRQQTLRPAGIIRLTWSHWPKTYSKDITKNENVYARKNVTLLTYFNASTLRTFAHHQYVCRFLQQIWSINLYRTNASYRQLNMTNICISSNTGILLWNTVVRKTQSHIYTVNKNSHLKNWITYCLN